MSRSKTGSMTAQLLQPIPERYAPQITLEEDESFAVEILGIAKKDKTKIKNKKTKFRLVRLIKNPISRFVFSNNQSYVKIKARLLKDGLCHQSKNLYALPADPKTF